MRGGEIKKKIPVSQFETIGSVRDKVAHVFGLDVAET